MFEAYFIKSTIQIFLFINLLKKYLSIYSLYSLVPMIKPELIINSAVVISNFESFILIYSVLYQLSCTYIDSKKIDKLILIYNVEYFDLGYLIGLYSNNSLPIIISPSFLLLYLIDHIVLFIYFFDFKSPKKLGQE